MIPLSHIKVIELAGLAPVPLCGLILSDFGANVIRIDNLKQSMSDEVLNRGKRSICLDLKEEKQVNIFKRLLRTADVLLDPFRPGVLEKLKLGPGDLHIENPKLIIARLTGYGQPTACDSRLVADQRLQAGHDINYLAMSGVLSRLGPVDPACPQPPVNLLADFAGGALTCAFGVILALLSRERSGRGEVLDCSMTAGSSYLASFLWASRHRLPLVWPRGERYRAGNLLDGGAPFYRCYRTADARFVAVGAIEPQFYSRLLQMLGVVDAEAPQFDLALWDKIASRFSDIFMTGTQGQWVERANKIGDCCVTPVLELDEAAQFWGDSFIGTDGSHREPRAQPRFSSMNDVCSNKTTRPTVGADTLQVLRELGCTSDEIANVLPNPNSKL